MAVYIGAETGRGAHGKAPLMAQVWSRKRDAVEEGRTGQGAPRRPLVSTARIRRALTATRPF